MTNAEPPFYTSPEVARQAGTNTEKLLAERGRDVEWLAAELGTPADDIRRAFTVRMPFGLLQAIAAALDVRGDSLLEGVTT